MNRPAFAPIAARGPSLAMLCVASALLVALTLALLGRVSAHPASRPAVDEDQLKAVFIYNFGKFVRWPQKTFKTKKSPIVVGVLGRTGVAAPLAKAAEKGSIRGRRFEVRTLTTVEAAKDCQILFVSQEASVEALKSADADIAYMKAEYKKRRNYIHSSRRFSFTRGIYSEKPQTTWIQRHYLDWR